mmetsp:Transcript_34485/g.111297  ORF Transcript_34485/g.111297 Transcript_34485/m.111297 type:complete len:245 (-) Transcript_34485:298-1032(-)
MSHACHPPGGGVLGKSSGPSWEKQHSGWLLALCGGRAITRPEEGGHRDPEHVVLGGHNGKGQDVHRGPGHHICSHYRHQLVRGGRARQRVCNRVSTATEIIRPRKVADEHWEIDDVVKADLEADRMNQPRKRDGPVQPHVPEVVERSGGHQAPARHDQGAPRVVPRLRLLRTAPIGAPAPQIPVSCHELGKHVTRTREEGRRQHACHQRPLRVAPSVRLSKPPEGLGHDPLGTLRHHDGGGGRG